MWTSKLFGLILTSALSLNISCAANQEIVLECEFSIGLIYTCTLYNVTVLNPTDRVVIKGAHVNGRSDLDVRRVDIAFSNTPFIIQQIFMAFPNFTDLSISHSRLHSLHLSPEFQLRSLSVTWNPITSINRNTFQGQTHLQNLNFINSNITKIASNAFDDLHALTSITFTRNNIEELPHRIFSSLTNVTHIVLNSNQLSSIHEGDFADNVNLQVLRLDGNKINEIHPNAFDNLRNSLTFVELLGNRCVNSNFQLRRNNAVDWIGMYEALQTCFQNYLEAHPSRPPENDRNITLQFRGTLKLFDESGKLIIEV